MHQIFEIHLGILTPMYLGTCSIAKPINFDN